MAQKTIQRFLISLYGVANRAGIWENAVTSSLLIWLYFLYKKHLEDSYAILVSTHPELFAGGHILDVGANIGYTALLFAQVADPQYRVYGFEPEKKNYELMRASVKRKRLDDRIVPIHAAVGSKSGTVKLWYNPVHIGDHRIATSTFDGEKDAHDFQETPLVSLDAFAHDKMKDQPVSFIKIDVQGFETEVCAGMVNLIEKNPDTTIGIEYGPHGIRALGFDPRELLTFFKSRGYLPHLLTRAQGLQPTTYARLQEEYPEYETGYCDIIFSKKQLHATRNTSSRSYRYYYNDIEKLRAFVVPRESPQYLVMLDTVSSSRDIQSDFTKAHTNLGENGRILVTFHNYLWEPLFTALEYLHIKKSANRKNWLSPNDVRNLLYLADFEIVRCGKRMICPVYIPLISWLLNTLGQLPFINALCVTQYIVARPIQRKQRDYSVSIIVPARNEKGNIESIVRRIPHFGTHQEIVFIEGHSKDGTWSEIQRVAAKYKGKKDITIAQQSGKGKGDAVRLGFDRAKGEVLMILDADMTVPPEDLPRFYEALASGKGDFINGSRLVYPMEKEAMRFLNTIANKVFALLFTWLLDQEIKDTLCGTKVLLKSDYERIAAGRSYFGDFDPFGDFDLLFGAVKQNLKIIDLPIQYRERTYGSTQISRFSHGWLLLRMCIFAARKIKFY